jgi:hypothetical protein
MNFAFLLAEETTWFTPTFVVATFGLITSIVAYLGNQQFTLRKERKQELMKLLTKIIVDCHDFKLACINALAAHHRAVAATPKTVPTMPGLIATNAQKIEEAQRKKFEALGKVHNASSQLRADCMMLDLVVGEKGDDLGQSIANYFVIGNNLASKGEMSIADFELTVLTPAIAKIEGKMKPLWKQFGELHEYPETA